MIIPFSECIDTLVKDHRSLFGRMGEMKDGRNVNSNKVLHQGNLASASLHLRGSICVNWLKTGNTILCCQNLR